MEEDKKEIVFNDRIFNSLKKSPSSSFKKNNEQQIKIEESIYKKNQELDMQITELEEKKNLLNSGKLCKKKF